MTIEPEYILCDLMKLMVQRLSRSDELMVM